MANDLNEKAPAISWLGQLFVPLGSVLGSIETALLCSILLTQFAMLFLLFRVGLGMSLGSRLNPAAGVLFVAASQLFVGLSHQMFVEPLQALATVWMFYVALKAPDWPKSRIAVHWGAALVLGLAAKVSSPAYCLLPCIYCVYLLVRKPGVPDFQMEWKVPSSRIVMVAFGCRAILCALWYGRHYAEVWRTAHNSSWGDVALNYGSRDTFSHKFVLWCGLFVESFLSPILPWGYVIAIVIAVVVHLSPSNPSQHRRWLSVQPVAVLSAIQIALMLVVFSLNITVEPRYMFALLPCLSILFMQLCVFLPRKATAALLALGAVQWALVNGFSLGIGGHISAPSRWLQPVHPEWSQYDELARAVRLTDSAGRYNIVAVEEPWLNANSAQFFAAKQSLKTGPRGSYTSVGYAQQDVGAAMRHIDEFQARYVITLDESHQSRTPNFLNIVSSRVLERMRGDSRFSPIPFESGHGVLIFRIDPGTPAF